METETRVTLIVFYFLYIIGMSAAIIISPEKLNKNWGWIALGVSLGITFICLVADSVLSYRRKKDQETESIYNEGLYYAAGDQIV